MLTFGNNPQQPLANVVHQVSHSSGEKERTTNTTHKLPLCQDKEIVACQESETSKDAICLHNGALDNCLQDRHTIVRSGVFMDSKNFCETRENMKFPVAICFLQCRRQSNSDCGFGHELSQNQMVAKLQQCAAPCWKSPPPFPVTGIFLVCSSRSLKLR
jgi:hypothetical protein